MEKRNVKKNSFALTALVIVLIFVLFLAGAAAIFYVSRTVPKVETRLETVVILKDLGPYTDLPNGDEGTVKVVMRALDSDVNIGEQPPTRILLFRSKKLDGLALYYLYSGGNITGGIPSMTTAPINLLDGNIHTIIYTFKRGDKQALLVDGALLSEGDFAASVRQTPTGFLVKAPENEVASDNATAQVTTYDKMVSVGQVSSVQGMG